MIETIPALTLATQIINQPGSLLSGKPGSVLGGNQQIRTLPSLISTVWR
jgi:hypothetical protein